MAGQPWVLFFMFLIFQSETKLIKSQSKPNIIFIVADDMGWNDVSFHGSDQIPTPNIDALAYNGVILNNHYVQPICTPTRAALMTGKYPIHTGMQGSPLSASERRTLPLNEKTIADRLKQLGYSTRMVGKWHLGHYSFDCTPVRRGFDSHLGYYNGFISYYDHLLEDQGDNDTYGGLDFRRNLEPAWEYQGKYATDVFTEEAVKVIKNHDKKKPLFLYLAHLAVHAGNQGKWLEAPQKIVDKFRHIPDANRRTYAAMVSKLDDSVGEVLKALQETELLSNSIIVFLSDNGSPLNIGYTNWGNNQPFRGEKFTVWEGGVRTAAAVWSPLIQNTSSVSKQFMHVTDWLPTLYSAAGGKLKDLGKLDGINMWPTITENKESPRKEILLNINERRNYYGGLVVKKSTNDANGKPGTYKIIVGKAPDGAENGIRTLQDSLPISYNISNVLLSNANEALRQVTKKQVDENLVVKLRAESKFVCAPAEKLSECQTFCLFDLINDPCEQTDLFTSNDYTAIATYMQGLYSTYNSTLVPQVPVIFDEADADPRKYNFTWTPWISSSVM
ncbi:arylsulfatase B-like [Lycorma delicatula]|uniref:arylsulfatase B-like n=1 Tax=Lycorma delicatula TaxID=130591 RepID=UPI003F512DD6